MKLAHQTDEAFEPNAPVSYNSAQQYLLSDRKFGRRKTMNLELETGLDEAPTVVLTTGSAPSEGLLEQLQHAIGKFRELKSLDAGWDSYRGRRVHRAAIGPALEIVLESILKCKMPRIHPNSQGGIDLIWETEDRELSMSADAQGRFEVLFETPGQVEEPDGTVDLAMARSYLERLCTGQ